MGTLNHFFLESHIKNGYKTLIETGTGTGNGVNHAISLGFDRILSTEIVSDHAQMLANQYAGYPQVQIFNMESPAFLESLFTDGYIKENDKCVYWLDAHYPGADLGRGGYDGETDISKRLPLEAELEVLFKYKRHHDIILVDDLRIYERGPFEGKNLDDIGLSHIARYDAPDFLGRWATTHRVERLYSDQGYVRMIPRSLSDSLEEETK